MPEATDPRPSGASAEVRRRRRELWIILATAVAVVMFAIYETRVPPSASGASFGTDAVLVALINLNLILLTLLVFLVGRNIAKLVLDRRRKVMGSHLRTKLVIAFVAIALLPATLLFAVALSFVGNSVENWFNSRVENALEGSLKVAHAYYEDLGHSSLGFARKVAAAVADEGLLKPQRREALRKVLDAKREDFQLDLVEVFVGDQAVARSRRSDLPSGRIGTEPHAAIVRQAIGGQDGTTVDPVGESDMVRAGAPILIDSRAVGAVIVDAYVPKSVRRQREEIDASLGEYLRLKIQRRPIQTAYTITLVLVTLVVIFAATWMAIAVARGITVPLQRLAEGTRAVAHGDLDHHIEGEGEDEVGTVVTAFNAMTRDIQASRTELDDRRRYLEIVLGNITAGVISTDAHGRIATMNPAAASLLGVAAGPSVARPVADVFTGGGRAEVARLVADLLAAHEDAAEPGPRRGPVVERQLEIDRDGQQTAVLVTGTTLLDENRAPQGVVLFLEDVTHLLRVQRMEAWREVARRIAHEIKNPLTPIQLSAQRLRKRYAAQVRDDAAVFDECTRTIIQQVDDIRSLVNEFSSFARLPKGEHTPQDLNKLLDETLVLYREAHPQIDFDFVPAPALPVLELDREGVKRALINVLDNAVAACAARRRAGSERARVDLKTGYDGTLGVVRVEIADDGIGMSPEVKARLFEPYFSTKPDGTGLGLAIVSEIVADHHGFVRVRDNLPRGSRFVIEFPVRRHAPQLAARTRVGAVARG